MPALCAAGAGAGGGMRGNFVGHAGLLADEHGPQPGGDPQVPLGAACRG